MKDAQPGIKAAGRRASAVPPRWGGALVRQAQPPRFLGLEG